MSHKIEVTMFDEVSGNLRGVATAFFGIGTKSEKRICHAYITVEPSDTDITLTVPKNVPSDQIEEMLSVIGEFYKAVAAA